MKVYSNTTPLISLGLIPSFVQAATGMRAQGIYFSEGLVNRIATRLGELN
jgi:hypothetical protein